MLKNYVRTAIRSVAKAPLYSALNIAGLAAGLAVFFLISTWIRYELSYDTTHENAHRIFKLIKEDADNYFLGTNRFAVTPIPLQQALLDEVPGVEASTHIDDAEVLLTAGDRSVVTRGILASESFFDVFSFPLLQGDPETALQDPGSVLLTPALATQLFGQEDPVGSRIQYQYFGDQFDLTVTGLVTEAPPNSHFGFSFVVAAHTDPDWDRFSGSWGSSSVHTYALLGADSDPDVFAANVTNLIDRHVREEDWYDETRATTVIAQPVTDIHLRSHANFELGENGDLGQVRLGIVLALVILLIPCFNYMNLATARAATRQREVGVRKAIGADRRQLVMQFLGESLLTATLSALAAGVLVSVLQPVFNALVLRTIPASFLIDVPAIGIAFSAIVVVGLISGSYPALVLSRSQAASIFRGASVLTSRRSVLRNVLVIAQFSTGVALIFGTLVVNGQIRFASSTDTGMDREHVLAVRVRDPEMRERWEALASAMGNASGVTGISGASYLPTDVRQSNGTSRWDGNDGERNQSVYLSNVDFGYTDLLGLEVVRGRPFSRDFPGDPGNALLINETAARGFGWENPVGKRVTISGSDMQVVGVVRDYNFHSFRQPVAPLALSLVPDRLSYVLLKTDGGNVIQTLEALQETWDRFSSGFPFDYQFLDDAFNRHFEQDRRLADVLNAFSVIALVIACLGLFGLAAFVAQQRTKEIGVRKVLGARTWDIVLLLTRNFTALVGAAVVIGCPVSFVMMNRWLDGFAFRIFPGMGTVLTAASLALITGWITVAWQSFRAARLDPALSLRYE